MQTLKLLILGGSGEAASLARALDGDARFDVTLSLAGRTAEPIELPGKLRKGGFGGVEGLARALTEEGFDFVVDATHPFAAQMKANAIEAAQRARVRLLAIRRQAWTAGPGDRWEMVGSIEEAAIALGPNPRRVFLTTGRNELEPFAKAAQHFYLLRSVEAPAANELPPRVELITARGPFGLADELKLLEEHRIDVIVTKNSGGHATEAKLKAARALDLPVIMVRRPILPDAPSVATVQDALAWLDRQYHEVTSSA